MKKKQKKCTCEQAGSGVVSGQADPPAPAGRLWDPQCPQHRRYVDPYVEQALRDAARRVLALARLAPFNVARVYSNGGGRVTVAVPSDVVVFDPTNGLVYDGASSAAGPWTEVASFERLLQVTSVLEREALAAEVRLLEEQARRQLTAQARSNLEARILAERLAGDEEDDA